MTIENNKLYNLSEAGELIGSTKSTIKRYIDKSLINGSIKGVRGAELKRVLNANQYANNNGLTMQEIIQKYCVNYGSFRYYIKKFSIKPLFCIGVDRYAVQDVKNIIDHIKGVKSAKNNAKYQDQIKADVNIERLYNSKIDYTTNTIVKYLKPFHVNDHAILEAVINGSIPFSYDRQNKVFFTEDQAKKVKSIYKVIPDNIECSNMDLARRLNISNIKLNHIRFLLGIQGVKILGYGGNVFLTKQQTKQITDYWNEKKGNE